jgi:bis(5'-nucleosyl)-tetraphosphatase (symmetrical)
MNHAELKAKIIDLLVENHPAELARLTGTDDETCKKIVHQLYMERFNDPNCWQECLTGTDRIRCLINYFTRMRFCTADGTLDFRYKGEPPHQDPNFKPWFEHALAIKETIYFGHWASLLGKTQRDNIIGLDTGCVWGGALTAIRLEDREYFKTNI